MPVTIRTIEDADRPGWEALWKGYVRFYRRRVDADVTDFAFARLTDPARQPHGIVACDESGRLVGLAHYLFRPTSWVAQRPLLSRGPVRRSRHAGPGASGGA